MKKAILIVFIIVSIFMDFSNQSWAFASRHHHNQNDSSDGDYYPSDYTDNGTNLFGNYTGNEDNYLGNNTDNDGTNSSWNNSDSGSNSDWNNEENYYDPTTNSNDPDSTTVPEPLSLFLMGIGLAGIFYFRMKKLNFK